MRRSRRRSSPCLSATPAHPSSSSSPRPVCCSPTRAALTGLRPKGFVLDRDKRGRHHGLSDQQRPSGFKRWQSGLIHMACEDTTSPGRDRALARSRPCGPPGPLAPIAPLLVEIGSALASTRAPALRRVLTPHRSGGPGYRPRNRLDAESWHRVLHVKGWSGLFPTVSGRRPSLLLPPAAGA